jgi:5-oxoprolinase (ATP-hydrolysing) subunit A
MEKIINLNADLGESFGAWSMGDDAALLNIINSANIACGFHAGDPSVMLKTIKQAKTCRVSLGAHPSFPDLQGFGRRIMHLSGDEIQAMLIYQLGALAGLAHSQGGKLTHVKPHGALSNLACENMDIAQHIVNAIKNFDPTLIVLAPACSALAEAAQIAYLPTALEIFADRTYTELGHLRPRHEPGAVLHEEQNCITHVFSMLNAGGLVTPSQRIIPTAIHSICVHGDGPNAVHIAQALRTALIKADWKCIPLPAMPIFNM